MQIIKSTGLAMLLLAGSVAFGASPDDNHSYEIRVTKGGAVLMSGSIMTFAGRASPWEQMTVHYGGPTVGQRISIMPSVAKRPGGGPATTRVAFENTELVHAHIVSVGSKEIAAPTVHRVALQQEAAMLPGVPWVGTVAGEGMEAGLRIEVTLQPNVAEQVKVQ